MNSSGLHPIADAQTHICLSVLLIHSFILGEFTSTGYVKGGEEMTWPVMEGI